MKYSAIQKLKIYHFNVTNKKLSSLSKRNQLLKIKPYINPKIRENDEFYNDTLPKHNIISQMCKKHDVRNLCGKNNVKLSTMYGTLCAGTLCAYTNQNTNTDAEFLYRHDSETFGNYCNKNSHYEGYHNENYHNVNFTNVYHNNTSGYDGDLDINTDYDNCDDAPYKKRKITGDKQLRIVQNRLNNLFFSII